MGKKGKNKGGKTQMVESVQIQKPEDTQKGIFDDDFNKKPADSDSDDLAELNDFAQNGQKPVGKDNEYNMDKPEEAKVARPTTRPTDTGRKFAPEKYKYTFMDESKSATFAQNIDPTVIQPKKIEDAAELKKVQTQTEKEMGLTGSAWNKSGTTWVDKNLKLGEVKRYLVAQKIIIGEIKISAEGAAEPQKLELTDLQDMKGFCNLAVIRGEPRMGFELSFKAMLTGVEETYLDGMVCSLAIEELCDDGGEPEECKITMDTMLDTNQGGVAKEVVGYDDDCSVFCKAVVKALREYPKRASKV